MGSFLPSIDFFRENLKIIPYKKQPFLEKLKMAAFGF